MKSTCLDEHRQASESNFSTYGSLGSLFSELGPFSIAYILQVFTAARIGYTALRLEGNMIISAISAQACLAPCHIMEQLSCICSRFIQVEK